MIARVLLATCVALLSLPVPAEARPRVFRFRPEIRRHARPPRPLRLERLRPPVVPRAPRFRERRWI